MPSPLSDVKALTFDVFGTVVDWRTSVAREAEALFSPRGYKLDWHNFADRWREKYQPALEKVRRGERPWTKLDDLHEENLVDLLEEHKITGLNASELKNFSHAWRRLDPWPDTVPGLTRLKTKFILGTLSNGNIALMVNMAKYAGLPWDAILGAEIAQSYKTLPQTYYRSAAALDLRPEQCMMVAAHNLDLVAAAECGFRTAYVNRPTEYGANQKADMRAEHDFDVVADSMTDLAQKLGC